MVVRNSMCSRTRVKNEYCTQKEVGLFHLFLHSLLFDCVEQWTNGYMKRRAQSTETTEISNEEMLGYVSLEIAISISKLNNLKDYWPTKQFYG